MTLSAAEAVQLEKIRREIFLALFIALAVAIYTVEALLPSPVLGLRLGFANILALTALFLYGVGAAWIVVLARIFIGSLLLGNLFSPGFLLSLSGGITAMTLMSAAKVLGGRFISPIGVSVLGAVGHIAGQLLVASWLLVRHAGLWHLAPPFMLVAVGTGVANGLAATLLIETLCRHPVFQPSAAAMRSTSSREKE
ncbi:MAG: Gx transporter family protein [Deltaproteobacteria bacterium]|nr:Gx transporter family protein [Deltaproteobacteria bacterium]